MQILRLLMIKVLREVSRDSYRGSAGVTRARWQSLLRGEVEQLRLLLLQLWVSDGHAALLLVPGGDSCGRRICVVVLVAQEVRVCEAVLRQPAASGVGVRGSGGRSNIRVAGGRILGYYMRRG